MDKQREFHDATTITVYVCVMVGFLIGLRIFYDMRNFATEPWDKYFPEVGIWACWMVVGGMAAYGFFDVIRYLCSRRDRSS